MFHAFPGPLRVLGSGSALPGPPITVAELNDKLEALGVPAVPQCRQIARVLGIRTRHLCRDLVSFREAPREGDTNPDLAARAVLGALGEARLEAGHLQYLFGHTCSPHTLVPPSIAWVADRLEYAGPFAELRQACTGFANALQLAAGLLQAPGSAPCAIVGSETGSVFFDPRRIGESEDQRVNMMQMGDGAGAVVLGPADGGGGPTIESAFFGCIGLGKKAGFYLADGGSGRPFCSSDARIHEYHHDFVGVKEHGPELFVRGYEAAKSLGIDPEGVTWFLPHQANARMGQVLEPLLGIPEDRIVVDADRVGNLGSASIWVALDRLRVSGRLRDGDTVLVLGAEATKYMFGGFLYRHAVADKC